MITDELTQWLDNNHIKYKLLEQDNLFEVEGKGVFVYEDVEQKRSLFDVDKEGNATYASDYPLPYYGTQGIEFICFKFGDVFYYFGIADTFQFNELKYIGTPLTYETDVRYVNLGIHTPFELLNGSFGVKKWIEKAKFLGHDAIGICDMNTMAATLILQEECKAAGMNFVMGYSLNFVESGHTVGAKVYAKNLDGLQSLLRVQKCINVDSDDKTISIQQLVEHSKGLYLVMGKLSAAWILDYASDDQLDTFLGNFEGAFFQVDLNEYKAERIDVALLNSQKLYFDEIYGKLNLPPIAIADCYYLDKDNARNKIILNKIASGAAHEQSDEQYFKNNDELHKQYLELFADAERGEAVFREACYNTTVIADNATAAYETDRNFMPQYDMTPEEQEKYGDRHTMFIQLLEEGFKKLVPAGKEEIYRKQLEYEKYVLESTNNVDYMLVQYDTCNWARANNILVGCGRGSAGGCLVLYLLGITLIDPIKYDLIFERFLLPERAGLEPEQVTLIGGDKESTRYVELTLENDRTYKFHPDAELKVKRGDSEEYITVYADELQEGDDILFDNKDLLFTLNEI